MGINVHSFKVNALFNKLYINIFHFSEIEQEAEAECKPATSQIMDCLIGADGGNTAYDTLMLLCTNTVCLLPLALAVTLLCKY